jgi:hypothetical protein
MNHFAVSRRKLLCKHDRSTRNWFMRRNGESITRYLDKRDRSKSRAKPDRIAYSPKELAQAAGISLSLLYKMWREGKGPKYALIHKRRVIRCTVADEWLQSLEVA